MAHLTYLNNRYHDPAIGTFITVDPLVVKTGQPYSYANGNPITYSDPSGLETCYIGTDICWDSGDPQPPRPDAPEPNDDSPTTGTTLPGVLVGPHGPSPRPDSGGGGSCGLVGATPGFTQELCGGLNPNSADGPRLHHRESSPFSVGVDAGCWVFVCLKVGIDSGGPFANVGAGVAVATPGVVFSGSDNRPGETNRVFLSGDVGPLSVVAGQWVWDGDEFVRDGHFEGPSAGLSIQTPEGLFPKAGGGFVHWWNFG